MPSADIANASSDRPRVVIVGAGFGGLAAAHGLRGARARVSLIDQRNHHLFQPMLYQVAMAQVRSGTIAEPLRELFGHSRNVRPRMQAVTGVDLEARQVRFADGGHLDYDMLVLASGARYQYFGHAEWARHVLTLKSLEHALTLRERVFASLEMADRSEDEDMRRAHLCFVIVGAGSTGVELAGALGRLLPGILERRFPQLDPGQLRIVVADPKPHALDAMDASLSRYADRRLRALGVELRTGHGVEDIGAGHVQLDDGTRLRTATIIWAAGVQGHGAGDWLPDDLVDASHRVPVHDDLSVPGHPEVYAIGDTATARDAHGQPYPGLAAVAKQQGEHVARCIRARLEGAGDTLDTRFDYTDYGTMAMISNGSAVGQIRGRKVKGLVAWLLWGVVHLYFLVSMRNRVLVMGSWFWAMLAGRRQRVILSGVDPNGEDARSGRRSTSESDDDDHREASR